MFSVAQRIVKSLVRPFFLFPSCEFSMGFELHLKEHVVLQVTCHSEELTLTLCRHCFLTPFPFSLQLPKQSLVAFDKKRVKLYILCVVQSLLLPLLKCSGRKTFRSLFYNHSCLWFFVPPLLLNEGKVLFCFILCVCVVFYLF